MRTPQLYKSQKLLIENLKLFLQRHSSFQHLSSLMDTWLVLISSLGTRIIGKLPSCNCLLENSFWSPSVLNLATFTHLPRNLSANSKNKASITWHNGHNVHKAQRSKALYDSPASSNSQSLACSSSQHSKTLLHERYRTRLERLEN